MFSEKAIGLIISLSILALILFKHGVYWYTRFLIRRLGIATNGVVIGKYKKRNGGKFIIYEFETGIETDQKIVHQQQVQVWQNTYFKLDEGSKILVKYLSSNPQKATVIGDNFAGCGMIVVELLLLISTIGCVILIKTA